MTQNVIFASEFELAAWPFLWGLLGCFLLVARLSYRPQQIRHRWYLIRGGRIWTGGGL